MSRFLWLANEWLQSWQQSGAGAERHPQRGQLAKTTRRERSQKRLTMEAMEDRLLLSKTDLTSLVHAPAIEQAANLSGGTAAGEETVAQAGHGAHILPAKKVATQLAVTPSGGVKGGTAPLTATLTSNGLPLGGLVVKFQIKGRGVGKAVTDANGLATLPSASLKGLNVGTYRQGIVAVFNGSGSFNQEHAKRSSDRQPQCDHPERRCRRGRLRRHGSLTATLTSNGTALPGQSVSFQINGQTVGSITTNGQGVAILANVGLTGINAGLPRRHHRELQRRVE